jgi:two-component system, LuxR family, sensor kinase FixL
LFRNKRKVLQTGQQAPKLPPTLKVLNSLLLFVLISGIIASQVFAQKGTLTPSPKSGSDFSRDNPVKVVYPVVMPPYSFEDEKGEAQGLAVDLLRLCSKKTGIPVQFVSAPWNEGLQMMRQGKADIHAALYYAEDRAAYLDYVAVVAPSQGNIFYHKNIININGPEDLKGFKVGVVRGGFHEQYVQKHLPEVSLVSYQEFPDMVFAAQKGQIQVFIDDAGATLYRLRKSDLLDEFRYNPADVLYRNNFWMAVRKGNSELAQALQRGMALISPEERAALERKWLPMSFTKSADTLFIAMSSDYAPFTFINAEGQPAGFFVDVWKLWAERTGKKIEFLPSTWDNSLDNLRQKRADIHSGLFYSDDRAQWLDFSKPFYATSSCFFYSSKTDHQYKPAELTGRKIGALKGSYHEEYLRREYPTAEVIPYVNREKMIRAVAIGATFACFAEYSSTMSLIDRLGLTGIFDAGQARSLKEKVYAGVLKGNAQLLSLINTGLESIPKNELSKIEHRWILKSEEEYTRRLVRWFLTFAGIGSAIICLFIFWNRSLRRMVQARTANLEESEQRYRSTFEQAAVGIAHISLDGKFLRINQRFCDIVGYSRPEMLERKFQDITYPDDLAADLAEVNRLLSGEKDTYSMEKRYIRKDGGIVWVNLTVTLIRNGDNQPVWFVSIVEDISDRKRVQKHLEDRLNFEKMLTTISTQFINISIDRLDGEIKSAQQHICECLDIDRCALWQSSPDHPESFILTHDYVAPDCPSELPQLLDAKETFPWALEMMMGKKLVVVSRITDAPAAAAHDQEVCRHYGIKSVVVCPLYVGNGTPFGALGFNTLKEERDWSEEIISQLQIVSQIFANALNRKNTERNLLESEARLRLAADSANTGSWSWDYQADMIWATKKTRELYGYSPNEEITGKKFFRTLHPDDLERVMRIVQQAFRSGTEVQVEYRIVLPDKSLRWMGVRAQAFLKPSGDPDRMTGISIDITQQRQNEDEMAQLRNELAHLARVLVVNELSTSLAHEINQPLGAILNNASAARVLISQEKDSPKDLSEILTDIVQDAKRAGDVVRKIRGLVKKSEVQFEFLLMNDLINEVVKLFQNRIKTNNVLLLLDLQPNLANVKGDRVQLQQVLLNLITNALEAMKGKSTSILMIRTRMQMSDMVTVSVSDSGPGINETMKERVFKPFFTTKEEGLGIGLAICRSIIDEHGGRIWVENNPVIGVTFSFALKAWKGEPV